MIMLTREQFDHVFPNARDVDELLEAMNEMLPKYEIDTNERVAGFLAQCGHESGGFRVRVENLNYSAKALDAVFGKYFGDKRNAEDFERQPEKIANVVYASRMGNGGQASGDGWKHRGRGYIQLTGKNNYTKFGEAVGMDVDEVIEYLDTVEGALESACWFWKKNNLNRTADNQDIKAMTKKINGGYNGLEDREHHWEEILGMLGGEVEVQEDSSTSDMPERTLSVGMRGDDVAAMQEKLGIAADGHFGPGTRRAVKAWQRERGLVPDGIVGPNTLKAMWEG